MARASVSSITIDAQTGEVIESSNADELRYPASLAKVMTLYITFDALEKGLIRMDDRLPVSKYAASRPPSKLGLRPGSTISVKDAVHSLIVKSANDCAAVLAEGLGHSEENFAKTMTRIAGELGMKNSTFKNASGLPNKNQKTTARDMALLGAAIYHHFPQYYPLFATKKFTYNGRTHRTHNRLLNTFEGADGMKTGFTSAAGYNIITSAERDGQRVIAVTMGHRQLRDRDKKAYAMMNSGLVKLSIPNETGDSYAFEEMEPTEKPQEKQIAAVSVAKIEDMEMEEDSLYEYHWGIQIGAFSNYTKARNYALQIKKELARKFSPKSIDIEVVEKGSAVVYRSKIVGFAKKEADDACKGLKKSKKSCIVVALQHNDKLILAQNTLGK
jgi:D-alanyl-D-alanine carboxypeptidase